MKPKIAICTRPGLSSKDAFTIASNNSYIAIDWTIRLDDLYSFKEKRSGFEEFLGEKEPYEVRYHCPLAKFEIAHINPYISRNSVKLIKKCINLIRHFGAEYLTLHIGGASTIEQLSWDAATSNLSELVEYGDKKDIVICLENLKSGWTSDPVLFSKLVRSSGAKVTFDIGHANSSVYAVSNHASCVDFISEMSDFVVNAHVYEAEDPYHIAPDDLSVIEPALKELMKTSCDWWVVELEDLDSVEKTRSLLEDFLSEN